MKMNNGDIVIIGQSDRPCSEMAAIVTNVHQDTCNCQYLSEKKNDYPVMKRHPENLTRITDFGVRLVIEGLNYSCEPQDDLECIAKYHDGGLRKWQEEKPESEQLSMKAIEIMSDLGMMEKGE